jgi:two-component system chemotaxis sensor kinase CheA
MSTPNPSITFLHEAEDLLVQIEEIILEIHSQDAPSEPVNQLFRAFHTIKGSGAMFGFDAVAEFTHHVESVLDKVREGEIPFSDQLSELVLASKDQIKKLLEVSQGGEPVEPGSSERIIAALSEFSKGSAGAPPPVPAASAHRPPAPASGRQQFSIRFKPNPEMMAFGTNPVSLLNELRGLGECTVSANHKDVPALADIVRDRCYLSWDIRLFTTAGINAIRDVFIFAEDGSQIDIEAVGAPEPAPADSSANNGAVSKAPEKPVAPPKGEAVAKDSSMSKKASSNNSLVRVPSDKLDRLVTLVGELVMNQSRLSQVASRVDLADVTAPVEEIERLVSELRDNVLGIRMTPIGMAFNRLKRLVHDLSGELGKQIDLITEGAETELDKTVLDQIGDPLVHLIRNSVDHGIESADERELHGKQRRGRIRLAAAHVGSHVVITIEDDGRGLDPEKIRAKAISKNLIAPDAQLSEKEIFNLIFLPGFSTAAQVTSVSGRGVGMDVVKRQIDSLRGTVSLASQLGGGTTTTLTLPLTLAIIDGLLVEIGSDQFIVPMALVTENVELHKADRARNNSRNAVAVRGDLIPYVRLRSLFQVSEGEPDIEKIVIAQQGEQRVGLVVDRVLGSHQTVIQSIGRFYREVEIVSGATIMGDGRVALILDVAGLVHSVRHGAAHGTHAANQLSPEETARR